MNTRSSAAPSRGARLLAITAILVAGLCGGLIGFSVVDIQCDGDCSAWNGLGALVGALGAATGVTIVVVLTLRALGEWKATEEARRVQQ